MHSWVTVPAFSHLSAQHLPLIGAQQHPLMLQKERKKAAEEKMQPMQLIQCRYHAGTRRDLQPKEGPGRAVWSVHNPVSVCPSLLALRTWLQARPGVL